MRQIEQDIVAASRSNTSFHSGTSSSYVPDGNGFRDDLIFEKDNFKYKLWGNEIATGNTQSKEITVSDCGYATATTVSRLNAMFAGLDIPMSASVRKGTTIYRIHGQEVKPGMLHYYAGSWTVTIAQEA